MRYEAYRSTNVNAALQSIRGSYPNGQRRDLGNQVHDAIVQELSNDPDLLRDLEPEPQRVGLFKRIKRWFAQTAAERVVATVSARVKAKLAVSGLSPAIVALLGQLIALLAPLIVQWIVDRLAKQDGRYVTAGGVQGELREWCLEMSDDT